MKIMKAVAERLAQPGARRAVTEKQISRDEHARHSWAVLISADLFLRQAAEGGRQPPFMSFTASL